MKDQKILVTGASGFLGKNLAEALRASYPSSPLVFTGGHEDKASSVVGLDLTDAKEVATFVSRHKPDVVYHLGALVDLTRSFDVARDTVEANIIGTINLLSALSFHPAKRFIFASTEEVYGEGTLPYREDNEAHPPSPYAVTKLTCEHFIRLYGERASEVSFILRIGTMYGPHQPPHRYIYQIIQKALAGVDIPLTSGTKKRDYVYVKDVAQALLLAKVATFDKTFDVINVGGGEMTSLKELAGIIVSAAQSPSRLRTGVIPDRIGESDAWLLDIRKAKRVLGWLPKTDIGAGIKATVDYYKNLNK